LKTTIKFAIPIGGIISFIIFIYMIVYGVWADISFWMKVLVVLLFIFMSVSGWIEYERTVEK